MSEESIKTGEELVIRDEKGRVVSGTLNPNGRPKGKTLKEWAREKLMNMSDEEKEEFIKTLPKDILWRMAKGNPAQDLTSGGEKIEQIPIYGGKSIQGYHSDKANIPTDKKD